MDKAREINNNQKEEQVSSQNIEEISSCQSDELEKAFIKVHNGYTPHEIFEKFGRPVFRPMHDQTSGPGEVKVRIQRRGFCLEGYNHRFARKIILSGR